MDCITVRQFVSGDIVLDTPEAQAKLALIVRLSKQLRRDIVAAQRIRPLVRRAIDRALVDLDRLSTTLAGPAARVLARALRAVPLDELVGWAYDKAPMQTQRHADPVEPAKTAPGIFAGLLGK